MAKLNRSNDSTNLGPGQLGISQGDFREQQDVVGDSLLQLGGRGEVTPGAGTVNDPLNAPFVLYVNPYTGRDDFAFGSYATDNTDPLRRIELQRLDCGYTEAAPFATLNRAVIEAGIITSKSYLDPTTVPFQRVCIVLAAGTYDLLCDAGSATSAISAFVPGTTAVDAAYLESFNPESVGGIILPRGCSLVSLDLRKTILRPGAGTVPAPANEAADYSNRRTMLRVTGEGYYYGMTFMDEGGSTDSHHLMSCFEFASETQVKDFYTKIEAAFATPDPNLTAAAARETEYEIVGPQPPAGSLTEATDTTASASPYIYNCSIRSEYGLCGIFANGANVGGFRSMVIAQFTGVSLQNDYTSWQRYASGAWGNVANFAAYRGADPDDIRMNPNRRSFHIRAVNRAVIQEVSVFAIGQGVHHWTETGGELTITNSNSNFGGVSALSEGYQEIAAPQDMGFAATHQRVPSDLTEETNNIRKVFIGTLDASTTNNALSLTLTAALEGDETSKPSILGDYSLVDGSYLWVESPTTPDYRAPLAAGAWSPGAPDKLVITAPLQTDDSDGTNHSPGDPIMNGTVDTGVKYPDIAGLRVYVRRLVDTRSPEERRYSLLLNPPATARIPQRDYIARIAGDGVGNAGTIDTAVLKAGRASLLASPTTERIQLEFKQINPSQTLRPAGSPYRPGDVLTANNKHYVCNRKCVAPSSLTPQFLLDNFEENFVHMGDSYNPEDFFKNVQPVLIFDHDSDQLEASTTLGWVLDANATQNVWTGTSARNVAVQLQYKTSTDYRGLERWLTNNGGTAIANPTLKADRDVILPVPVSDVEFRRPSIIRMYGHAFEWAGFGNYTKGLPQYQGGMNGANKFTYYGTSELGGRVYFTGFNEEGFSVSPRGIEDIQTGEILSAEEINAPDVDIDIPTTFEDLKVLNELDAQGAQINVQGATFQGEPNWGDTLKESSTTEKGIIETATVEEAVAGTDDERAVTPLGVQARVNTLNAAIEAVKVPVGTILWHCATAAPTNFLVCDGSSVPNGVGTVQGVTGDFTALHAALAGTYGTGGGGNLLPDLQGTFVRGWTSKDSSGYGSTNPDPNRDFGSIQADAAQEHGHDYSEPNGGLGHSHTAGSVGGNTSPGGQSGGAPGSTGFATIGITIDGPNDISGQTAFKGDANETRPVNIALLPIIKF